MAASSSSIGKDMIRLFLQLLFGWMFLVTYIHCLYISWMLGLYGS